MTMYPPGEQTTYTPSPEQQERESALKRFNRLYIYLPVGIAVAFGIVLLVLMLIGIFAPGLVGAEEFLSGLADTILFLWTIPMSIFCAIVPIAYLGYLINRRQRRNQLPPDSPLLQHSRAQMATWKAQDIADQVAQTSENMSDRIAKPMIRLDSFTAYIFAWLDILTRPFSSEENDDPDTAQGPDGID